MSDAQTPLDLGGVGWYEVIHPTAATTLLAYVREDGSVYFPETNDGQVEFALAAARGHVHRLVRADDAEVEVARLRAKVDGLTGVLEPYTREYPRECNKRVAAENERDAALAEVKHLRAEVDRLEEDLSDRTMDLAEKTDPDSPAHAWDEDAAIETFKKAWHKADAERRAGERVRDGLAAVVRDHQPVKPGREAVLALLRHHVNPAIGRNRLRDAGDRPYDHDDLARGFDAAADAVLDLLPGRSEDEVKREGAVEALHDAADEYEARLPDGTGNGRAYNSYTVAAMLRARADRLVAEGGADRG